MDILSRNEMIAVFAVTVAIVGTLAVLSVHKPFARFLFIILTLALALTFYIYLRQSFRDGKSARELSKEELVQEAKRQLAEEQTKRDEAFKEARERLERERIEREGAEIAAREAHNRDKAEQEALETIAREDAVKKLRERIANEKAEQARQMAEANILGKWESHLLVGW